MSRHYSRFNKRNRVLPLTKRQQYIMDYLSENPEGTLSDLAEYLNTRQKRTLIEELKKIYNKGYPAVAKVRV